MFSLLLERSGRLRPAGPTSFTRQVPAALGAPLTLPLTAPVSRLALGATALHALPTLTAPMEGEGRLAGMVQPGHLLVGLELGLTQAAA